jgi:hypothetical protein
MFFDSINAVGSPCVKVDMRILALAALLAGPVAAQSLATDPPPILQIVRKPGTAQSQLRPYSAVRAEVNAIAAHAITGMPETWSVEAHYSFASIEDLDQRFASGAPAPDEAIAPPSTLIALYRPGWSFRPAEAVRLLARARYFNVTIFHVRAGTSAEFGELVRLRRATADAINLDRPDLAFQVISGAPAGTFVFLAPMPSLRAMDEGVNPVPVFAEPIAAARQKDGKQITSDIELSREHFLLRINPRLSWVANDFAELDRDFWRRPQ